MSFFQPKSVLVAFSLATMACFAGPAAAEPKTEHAKFEIEVRGIWSPFASYMTGLGPTSPSSNFGGGFKLHYAFSENFGAYTGLDLVSRGYSLNSGRVSSPIFDDVTFGIYFRHPGALGTLTGVNVLRLGAFAYFPTGDLLDYGSAVAASMVTGAGIQLDESFLFKLSDQFFLGPSFGVKYGIGSPYKANPGYAGVAGLVKTTGFLDLNFGASILMRIL